MRLNWWSPSWIAWTRLLSDGFGVHLPTSYLTHKTVKCPGQLARVFLFLCPGRVWLIGYNWKMESLGSFVPGFFLSRLEIWILVVRLWPLKGSGIPKWTMKTLQKQTSLSGSYREAGSSSANFHASRFLAGWGFLFLWPATKKPCAFLKTI